MHVWRTEPTANKCLRKEQAPLVSVRRHGRKTFRLSYAGNSYNKLGLGVENQSNAIFLVIAGDHGALGHSLDLEFGVHFLKFSFGFFVGLAQKFGIWGFSGFMSRHCSARLSNAGRVVNKRGGLTAQRER